MLTSAENGGNNFSSSSSSNFTIVAPSYDNTSGGIVVLHKLCDLINELGYSAKNRKRQHSSLGYKSPIRFLDDWFITQQKEKLVA